MTPVLAPPVSMLLRREIGKFLSVTRRRSECDLYMGRRQHRRHYRTWPLLVATLNGSARLDQSVALHSASEGGISFRSSRAFGVATMLAVKLFWHEARAYRVPVIVRRCDRDETGYIIGCQFALEDTTACEEACAFRPHWYDS